MAKILVTGGTGKIGSVLVKELKSQGADFIMLLRNPDKRHQLEDQGLSCVAGDYNDYSSLNKAMKGIERLFIVAAPQYDMERQEKNLIDAAENAGVSYILKISVIGSDPASSIHLTQSHARAEKALIASGIGYTVFHPHSFMQNVLANIPTIKGQQTIYGTMGETAIPMIDARDIGKAAARVLLQPDSHLGKHYTLTGPESLTQQEVAQIIGEVSGQQVQYVDVPDAAAQQAMLQMGMPEWLANDLLALNNKWKGGAENEPTGDLENILGEKPTTFKQFAEDHKALFT